MRVRALIPMILGLSFIYYGLLIYDINSFGASLFISMGLGNIVGGTKPVIKLLDKVYEKIKND